MRDRTDGSSAEEPTHAFLALGDSYTIGEGVAETERWPALLTERLRARGVPILEPRIIARTGWTAAELERGVETELGVGGDEFGAARSELGADGLPVRRFDLVSVLVGVNDQYRGASVEEYESALERLVARAVRLARREPSRLVLVSIPDWGVTPFAEGRDRARIGREIDAFNGIAQSVASAVGAHWVDVTRISRRFGARPGALSADGLHPSGEQYAAWADAILPAAARALGR